MRSNSVSVGSLEPVPGWFLEASSNLADSSELLFPESVHVSDVPLILVDVSQDVGLGVDVLSSLHLVSPVVNSSSPGSESVVHPVSSTLDGVLVSVSESIVGWSLEVLSKGDESLVLLSPESSDVSDVPLISVDVSVVGSLSSVVSSSRDSSSPRVDASLVRSDSVLNPSVSISHVSSVGVSV